MHWHAGIPTDLPHGLQKTFHTQMLTFSWLFKAVTAETWGKKNCSIFSEQSRHISSNQHLYKNRKANDFAVRPFTPSQVWCYMSHWFSKLKRIPSGPVQQLNTSHTIFHPNLLLSLCSHTVDFYGMGLIPIGCNGAGFSDALCACEQKAGWLAPRRFPLTVVSTEWANSLSHLPSPPGLLAAFRQNTSAATSEHVHRHVRACVTTAVICWYSVDFMGFVGYMHKYE